MKKTLLTTLIILTISPLLSISASAVEYCEPTPSVMPCYRFATQHLPSYQYNDRDEKLRLMQACSNNFGSTCLESAIGRLSTYEYNDLDKMVVLINSCKGVKEPECIDLLCEGASHYCNDLDRLSEVLRSCAAL